MHFIKSADYSLGKAKVRDTLRASLKSGPVLWLIAGGSNIPIEVAILNEIDRGLTSQLNILLTDERYGPKGHANSNYQQLISSGFIVASANFIDILGKDLSPEQTLKYYAETYKQLKASSKIVIGQLGIGEDGHIAGALPDSPAVASEDIATYYQAGEYKRLTLSLNTLRNIDKAYAFCFGQNKLKALQRLKMGQETLESLPSLILKELPQATVYNDQLED